jgi:serine/threonine protein kinase
MARVYLARIVNTGRPIALKVALVSDEKGQSQNVFYLALNNEVSILQHLRHPNIVRILPILKSGLAKAPFIARALDVPGRPWYFVMEYLQGPHLEELTNRGKGISVGNAVEVAFQIGMALEFMHDRGYAHLDIKPSNIMFRKPIKSSADSFEPVLIDFGIAAKAKQVVLDAGSIPFLPPERLLYCIGELPSDQITNLPAIDVYGLGVTLYKMVTGRLPFEISRRRDIQSTVLNNLPPKPRQFNSDIPPRLERIILQSLAKAPDDRPTINEMVTELDSILTMPQLSFTPSDNRESPRRQWQDWLDRYPRWTAGLGVGALVLTLVAMVFLIGQLSGPDVQATETPTVTAPLVTTRATQEEPTGSPMPTAPPASSMPTRATPTWTPTSTRAPTPTRAPTLTPSLTPRPRPTATPTP